MIRSSSPTATTATCIASPTDSSSPSARAALLRVVHRNAGMPQGLRGLLRLRESYRRHVDLAMADRPRLRGEVMNGTGDPIREDARDRQSRQQHQ
jgi:hypothetical protein